jgi:hypothetical protein
MGAKGQDIGSGSGLRSSLCSRINCSVRPNAVEWKVWLFLVVEILEVQLMNIRANSS